MTPYDYVERVYAGVLGKIIGVYLGRPIEGSSYEYLTERFGEVIYYVHEQQGKALVVADDDISGTFTFLRALPDNGNNPDITPENIGDTWMNYIIENRTILWWGGMGVSTEQTAFARLKNGMKAPASGSMTVNSQVVAEQIGAQIFIDAWGMICPGDSHRAADYARRAASVSHDGEAIYGAQVVAAMVAAAFVEPEINRLLDIALNCIPKECLIARLIADIRHWHAETPDDWRATRTKIKERYGYDRYGGGCHILPNHALIIHALLHGNGDFSRSLMIVNTCGWDTDCNSANVGCILGIRNGLQGLEGTHDWRGPIADRMFLPTADGGRCVTDALQEAVQVANIGLSLSGEPPLAPKNGARFSFAFPGSVQGFASATARIANSFLPGRAARGLEIQFDGASPGLPVRVQTPTFLQQDELDRGGYSLIASPTLYPGQTVEANLILDATSPGPLGVRLFVQHYAQEGGFVQPSGPSQTLFPGTEQTLHWTIPLTGRQPIAGVGIEIVSAPNPTTSLFLDYLTWSGTPECELHRPEHGNAWQNAWLNGASVLQFPEWFSGFRMIQNEGTGLVSQGTREWIDYSVSVRINAHLCERFGLAVRVQGMRRYYALLLTRPGTVQLIKVLNEEVVIAEAAYEWCFDETYDLSFSIVGSSLRAFINNQPILDFIDHDNPLKDGALGIVCTSGNILVETVRVVPAAANIVAQSVS